MPKTSHVASVAAVVFVAFTAWLLSGVPDEKTVQVVDGLAFTALGFIYVPLAALVATRTTGRTRVAWVLMTIAMVGWFLGEVLWTYYVIADTSPFPSLADAAYLTFPPFVCAALLLFPGVSRWSSRTRLVLDGVTVAGALFLISWLLVMRSVYVDGELSRLELLVSLAYPASDVLIMTVCVLVLVRTTAGVRVMLTLLVAGLACEALADSAWFYLQNVGLYDGGHFIDVIWFGGVLLIIVSFVEAYHSDFDDKSTPVFPGWASVWLPYVPVMIAAVFVAVTPVQIVMEPPVIATGALLIVAAFGRQLLEAVRTRKLLATVSDQARRDPLTGLANRARFSQRLDNAMRLRGADSPPLAVIALDLNDFKAINDALGHPAGDELLRRAGERILGCVRPDDTLARTGGDEFAILVEGRIDSAHLVAQRVVDSFEMPFPIAGTELTVHPSVGLAVATADEIDLTAEELLARADIAMYAAKRNRERGVHSYTPEIDLAEIPALDVFAPVSKLPSRSGAEVVTLLSDLRRALRTDELQLRYQPKVHLATGLIVGVEALLRWDHPVHGMLEPVEFLPLVRRHGLMRAITDLVTERALDDVLAWRAAGFDVPVAINVFAPSLIDSSLLNSLTRALDDHGIPGHAVTLEITEESLLNISGRAPEALRDIRSRGIKVAIDDFGTGYSALSYLRELAFDEIKLDRSFITPLMTDPRAVVVMHGILNLVSALELTVVAEGVEDADTAKLLARLGCDVAQGYYFSPPLPSEELVALLRTGKISPVSTNRPDQRSWSRIVPAGEGSARDRRGPEV